MPFRVHCCSDRWSILLDFTGKIFYRPLIFYCLWGTILMSYEPLHHKYRPQTFKDLVGQEAIANTLISAIESAKIAPAYLFTGPRGTGKTSSARILAKSLNCLASEQPTSDPCGKCEVCQAIASGNALDVIEIDAASNTGVDNIREIIERSRFAPVQSRYKVYAIDECHMLSTAAFNALLKTLEEPPPQVVFILATTDPQRVLSTIISRCQRFDYRRIRLDAMVKHLSYIAQQENIAIAPEAVTLVAQIANGGLRDAESLLDQLSLFPEAITVDQIWDLIGAVPEKDLLALLTAIRKEDVEDIVTQCRNLLDRGREPLVLLQNLAGFYLNLLIAKTAPDRQDLVAVTETCWQQLSTEAQHWQYEKILQGQQQLKQGEVQIKNTTQPRLWLEVTLLGLLSQNNAVPDVVKATNIPPKQAQPQTKSNETTVDRVTNSQNNSNNAKNLPQTTNSKLTSSEIREVKDVVSQNQQVSNQSQSLPTKKEIVPSTPSTPQNSELASSAHKPESAATTLSNTDFSPEEQAAVWQQVIDCIHPPMTQALLRQQCHLISLTDSLAIVGISSAPLHKMNLGKVPNIEKAFAQVCQRKIKVTLEVATKTQPVAKNLPPRSPVTETKNLPSNNFAPQRTSQQTNNTTSLKKNSLESAKQTTTTVAPPKASNIAETQIASVSDFVDTAKELPVTHDEPVVTANTNNNPHDFNKAVELVAQKFDGEIVELQESFQNAVARTTVTTEAVSETILESNSSTEITSTTTKQKVVIKREAIADYDDEDIPF